MTTHTSDTNADFVVAVSTFAALEGACTNADADAAASEVLPFLGMARSELTDYGQRLPTHLEDIPVASFADGLTQLGDLLSRMLATSHDLALTLRLHAARQILREGTERYRAVCCGVQESRCVPASSFKRDFGCTLLECGLRGQRHGEVSG